MLGEISADDIWKYFYNFFQKIRLATFHENYLLRDNLHEMSNFIFSKKKKIKKNMTNLSSAELETVKGYLYTDNMCFV